MMKTSLLIFSIFLTGCCTSSLPPHRPSNVPASAFWIGGVDGGAWVYVKQVDKKKGTAELTIYNDRVMQWAKGAFKVNEGTVSKEEIASTAQYFDGRQLVLSDGRKLQIRKSE